MLVDELVGVAGAPCLHVMAAVVVVVDRHLVPALPALYSWSSQEVV